MSVDLLYKLLQHFEPRLTDRKARLLACACARLAWHLLGEPRSREAVEAAEQFAEGRIGWRELSAAHTAAREVTTGLARESAEYVSQGAIAVRGPLPAFPGPWPLPLAWALEHIARGLGAHAAHTTPADQAWQQARDAACAGAYGAITSLIHCAVGTPAPPPRAWPDHVVGLARACDEGQPDFPILADSLEDLGDEAAPVAEHCRQAHHARCCWVLDWILGKTVASDPAARALVVRQPRVELILRGACTIEARPRPTNIRERVHLYASDEVPADGEEQLADRRCGIANSLLPRGLLLGTVEIVGCRPFTPHDVEPACSPFPWARGRYAWLLARPQRAAEWIRPARVPGEGFFNPFRG